MQVTRSQSFSDVDVDAKCDCCEEPLPGGQQLYRIDDDDSNGFFCSRPCAEKAIERNEQ